MEKRKTEKVTDWSKTTNKEGYKILKVDLHLGY